MNGNVLKNKMGETGLCQEKKCNKNSGILKRRYKNSSDFAKKI